MIASRPRNSREGFTLVEVLVVGALMTLLAMLLQTSWSGFGRPLIEAIARARIAEDANMAAATLARDFGGSLPGNGSHSGSLATGKLVGRMEPDGIMLRLCFDGGADNGLADWGDTDTVITYLVQDGNLVRWDETAGTTFVVAHNVQSWELTDLGNGVEIRITFSYRTITRTYTLVGLDP
jgi:type II secretory pathway pseudopilin PulG